MKNEPLWNKTVDILVKAYLGDTLEYGEPCGCAVGNLIAANCEYTIDKSKNIKNRWIWVKDGIEINHRWGDGFSFGCGVDGLVYDHITQIARIQAESTGYSYKEVVLIEESFHIGTQFDLFDSKDAENFNGLMSVIDTLMQIHEANDTEVKEAKGLFRKELAG